MEADAEPMEADPVPAEADPVAEEAVSVAAEETAVTSDREGQRLVSTQTVQHEYLTLNGKVARETISVDGTVTTVMDFIYDESGRPFALKYSDDGGKSFDTYYYVLNLQGDVVKLVWYIPGFEYEAVATYTYDAWGNILTATGELAEINPLRYRGYYYDSETGFYYLQSRYYDPANRRFINADGYASTGQGFSGTNMFVYCGNNPVMHKDPSGRDYLVVVDEEEISSMEALGFRVTVTARALYKVPGKFDNVLVTYDNGAVSLTTYAGNAGVTVGISADGPKGAALVTFSLGDSASCEFSVSADGFTGVIAKEKSEHCVIEYELSVEYLLDLPELDRQTVQQIGETILNVVGAGATIIAAGLVIKYVSPAMRTR